MRHSGGGRPDRILRLLWRNQPRPAQGTEPASPGGTGRTTARGRGRRPGLDVDRVVATAIQLADQAGLAAASMAGVAKALEVGTMTLYTYVPSKEELLDLMVDEVFLERELPGPGEARPPTWREQIAGYAEQTRAMYRRHPWLIEVSMIRPPPGPGLLAAREYLLSALLDIGLTPAQTNTAALAITTYVDGAAHLEAESEQVERETGQSHEDWWGERNDLWETYFDVDRHPAMTAIWTAGGYGDGTVHDQAVEISRFGLDRLLDGIQDLAELNLTGRA